MWLLSTIYLDLLADALILACPDIVKDESSAGEGKDKYLCKNSGGLGLDDTCVLDALDTGTEAVLHTIAGWIH